MAENDFGMGYALGADSNGGGGMFGGDGWLGLILFAMIFGGGFGGGWGNNGALTRADINEGFALQNITSGIQAIQHGQCDSTYALTGTINNSTNAIIANSDHNHRSLMDFLVNEKIESLREENTALKFQASQAEQNNYIAALVDAKTAELIRRIAPTPVPSYSVPAPYPYCGNSFGCGGCC